MEFTRIMSPLHFNYAVLGDGGVSPLEVRDEGILVATVLKEIAAKLANPRIRGADLSFWLVCTTTQL